MPWKADLIYTKPNPGIIKYLSGIDGFSDELFLVNDLEGIMFDSIRSFMLSDTQNEKSFMKHTLPKEGLLAIKPKVSRGYEEDYEYETDEFWDKYKNYPTDKWGFIDSVSNVKLDINLDLTDNQLKLLTFLKSLNAKFDIPILYYYCLMWGGLVEQEYAIVFDKETKIFLYDPDKEKDFELIRKEKKELESTLLQTSFKYLDLELPTWFFALHEGSFDWKRYHIKKGEISI